jgi:hypothetical protein
VRNQLTRALLMLMLLCVCSPGLCAASEWRDGDIIFHTSSSSQSLAIQRATRSRWSHMGMIIHRDGKPYVFEAIAIVRYTPLEKWIARGEKGHFVVKRLAAGLTDQQAAKLRKAASSYEGKPYDLYFEWSDERLYCSELVWKMYQRALGIELGARQKLREFDLSDPAVRAKIRERYGNAVPLAEPVISPAAMFSAKSLETVVQR